MRIVVMSDTHGNISSAEAAIQQSLVDGPIDLVIHAGDHYSDGTRLQRLTGIPVVGVSGNRDYPIVGPTEEIFDADGVKIYVTHGHEYSVKARIGNLERRASEFGAKVIIYGHTHVADIEWLDGGKLLLNPGSLYRPRDEQGRTFALLEIKDGGAKASIVSLVR